MMGASSSLAHSGEVKGECIVRCTVRVKPLREAGASRHVVPAMFGLSLF
jgi:hypothetical protein